MRMPAGRPSRADVAAAIWNAEGLDRAVLTDCWEIAGRVLDLYPEAEDLLGPCPSEGAEPAQDLPVIAYGDIPEGATYEMRQRWVKKGVMSEPVLGDARYHLVPAPEPDPDAELVNAIREASHSIRDGKGYRVDPLPGLPESSDMLKALRTAGWDLVKTGEQR